jgi:hypothetical protein
MLTPIIKAAPRRRRIALVLGGVGVASLIAAALPELTAAGAAAVTAAASPATVQIDNFAFAPAAHRHCRHYGDLEERGRQPAPHRR